VPKIALTREQYTQLTRAARAPSTPQRLARQSAIVLMAADGANIAAISQRLRVSAPTVRLWIRRFLEGGVDGIMRDAAGRGRRAAIDGAALTSAIEAASASASQPTGTVRELARTLGVSASSVWRALQKRLAEPATGPRRDRSRPERR
jgi:transposase